MSLQLDDRRRAMLAEMKIPLWLPRADANPESMAAGGEDLVCAPVSVATGTAPVPMAARTIDDGAAAPAPAAAIALAVDLAVERMDWAALRETVMACSACGLCEGRKSPVFAIDPAPVQADWLIVGEPPDEHEERAGTPFVGSTGQLLDNMLRAVQCTRGGQGRAGARVTSVVKCRPGVARNPQADELAQCAVYLRREIALTQPRVIVAMGRFAALSLLAAEHPSLSQTPFGQLRGRLYRSHGIPVVVTYHPSKLLRAPLEKAAAWADLCLARAQLVPPPSASLPPSASP